MSELKKEIYHISGMHCRSCEILLEGNLSEVSGVRKASVNYRKGIAEVLYDRKPEHNDIVRAVRNAGYALGVNKKRPLFSSDPAVYAELGFAVLVLVFITLWLKVFGVFDISLQFSSTPGLLVVALIGLTAGVSTCMALIGGLVLGISSRHAEMHPEATAAQKFRPHLFFNAGRLASYALFGGLAGLAGSVFRLSGSMLGLLVMFAGVVMFVLSLKMTGIFPRLDGAGLLLPKGIARFLGLNRETKEYSHKNALLTGVATFFLPCGFTQAMQIYAISTGSFVKGASIMFLFALGTVPGLLGIGGLASVVKGWFARYFFKFVALVLLIMAVWNISNGFNLTGITLANSGGSQANGRTLSGKLDNGQRVVEITQSGSGYSPRDITVQVGVPVRLLINATNIYACSSIFVITKFNIWSRLSAGVNELTFTPTETGPVRFSCAMGMYTGVINVIN